MAASRWYVTMLTVLGIDLTEPSAKQKLAIAPPECWLPKAFRSCSLIPSMGTDVFIVLSSWANWLHHAHPPSACELLVAGRFSRLRSPNMNVLLVPSLIPAILTEL